MRSWVKWGLPVSIVVLLAGAGGGVVLADQVYREPVRGNVPEVPPETAEPAVAVESPGGVKYTAGAAQHPDQRAVMVVLDNHFRSINTRNYDLWKSTVVPSKWAELPKDKWMRDYGSTEDLDMTVHRIDTGPDGSLAVLLTFKSFQEVEHAPANVPSTCLEWNLVYPMVLDESGRSLRLDTSKLPNSALVQECRE
ncbi:hypothetical protein [Saccharopolyspora hordei]|uniref:Uncharacterized protein n=1 Tax=Saccharopolyspora hordei TaxID=1838 RepID=A0A853ATP8_9PSEU|nr:hypothetical protein [Saccharopolyspora hordei]NYI86008.1 hypothetical protein [Saccharopolyspora hordei]